MRKAKILALTLLCFLVTALFVGCVETVSVTHYLDGNGNVHRDFLVTYDVNSSDASTMREQIKRVMSLYVEIKDLSDFAAIYDETEGEVRLELFFPSIEDYYIWLGYNGREENEAETPAKSGLINAYDRTLDTYLTERNIAEIRALVDEAYRDFPLSAEFYYTYGTTNRSTISNGERTEKDGVYYHTWRIYPEAGGEMAIRIYGLNVTAIYLIAILIFVLSLAIIFVIMYSKKRNQKRRAELPHDSPRPSENAAPLTAADTSSGTGSTEQTPREGAETLANGQSEDDKE